MLQLHGEAPQTFKSVSGKAPRKGFVDAPENPVFTTRSLNPGGIPRNTDSEYKILEEVAKQLGDNRNAKGILTVHTNFEACGSCQDVFTQFNERYPNIWLRIGIS